ncbi:hypothetical protein PHMEG_00012626 [Phytophthora megakarya]|uniref:Uncharacterized protein n=1 Tax=Phytophthora megakarya TaxID=4795 RepID=A0A225W9Y8_9STRA|nr:hypothetical protein PHMEG_00012626 [Phytophthora megakarya]
MNPRQNAKQAQFVSLTDNWASMLSKANATYRKQKTFSGPFVLRLHMYAAKEVREGIRRAIPARISEAADAIESYLTERADVHVGDLAPTHWTISQARQPGDSAVSLPDNTTFRRSEDGAQDQSVVGALTIQLNGSMDIQLIFNIQELWAIMELPNYSLIGAGLLSNFQPPREPSVNVDNINHLSD